MPTTLLLQDRATEAPTLPLHSSTPSPAPTVNPSPTKSPRVEHHRLAATLASVSLGWDVAWDDDQLVFEATADNGRQHALLALNVRGRLTRVSDVISVPAGATAFTFAAQP